MKRIVKIITLSTMLFVGCAFTLPAATGTLESHAASKVKISKTKATVIKGKTLTLKVKGTKKKAKWSSSKKSIVTVNSKGRVTARKAGGATITAKIGRKKYRCKVSVKNPTTKLNKTSIKLAPKGTYKLSATSDGVSKKASWKSYKTSVATVNSAGTVTAKAIGTAIITAKMNGVSKSCKVTVSAPVGSKYNPADARNGVTVKTVDGTMRFKVNNTYRNERAVQYLKDKNNWYSKNEDRPEGYNDDDRYAEAISDSDLIVLEFSIKALEGFTSHKLYGNAILPDVTKYNKQYSKNIKTENFYPLNALGQTGSTHMQLFWGDLYSYQSYAWWQRIGLTEDKPTITTGLSMWVPKGTKEFYYPIYRTYDPDRCWVKYTF